jgi:hypothetical protein
VDASVVAACERLDVDTLATLDRRHFSVVRPRHCHPFGLFPIEERPSAARSAPGSQGRGSDQLSGAMRP